MSAFISAFCVFLSLAYRSVPLNLSTYQHGENALGPQQKSLSYFNVVIVKTYYPDGVTEYTTLPMYCSTRLLAYNRSGQILSR